MQSKKIRGSPECRKTHFLIFPMRCYGFKVLLIWTGCVCIVFPSSDFYPFIVLYYYSTMFFRVDWDWLFSFVSECSIVVDICTFVSNWQCPRSWFRRHETFCQQSLQWKTLESSFLFCVICINQARWYGVFFSRPLLHDPIHFCFLNQFYKNKLKKQNPLSMDHDIDSKTKIFYEL